MSRRSRRCRTTFTATSRCRSPASGKSSRRPACPMSRSARWVRTGDTPPRERERMRRRPPHILVTTPESLYVLLGSESGRKMLAHRAHGDRRRNPRARRRTSAAAISPCRWNVLARSAATQSLRIGLSATQNPVESGCAFPCRRRAGRSAGRRGGGHRYGASAPARPRPRVARFAAGGGDVGRSLAPGLRSPGSADRGASHHAGVRQHAAHGGARRRARCRSGSARTRSPRITAAWPRTSAFRPSRGSSAAS